MLFSNSPVWNVKDVERVGVVRCRLIDMVYSLRASPQMTELRENHIDCLRKSFHQTRHRVQLELPGNIGPYKENVSSHGKGFIRPLEATNIGGVRLANVATLEHHFDRLHIGINTARTWI